MIKTIAFDISLSFVIGTVFALSAAPLLEKEESLVNTYFIRALMFQVLVFFPFGLFLAKFWTAWSWNYFINPHNHSRLWTLLAVSSYIPAMIGGFHISYTLIRAGKRAQVYIYSIAGALACALMFLPIHGRIMHVSNVWLPAELINTAPLMFKKGWFMLGMTIGGAYFFLGMVYVLKLNREDRKRVAREAFSKPAT